MVGVTGQVQQVASSIVHEGQSEGWSGVTSQGSEQVASSVDQSRRSQQRNRNRMQDRYRGPGQTQHQGRVWQVWP
ncbi:unnamed protein product, partial [Staurois parvus]